MTDPRPLPPSIERRLADLRQRRAAKAAARAEFETRRQHGLRSRHEAKLAHLAARESEQPNQPDEPTKEPAPPEAQGPTAA